MIKYLNAIKALVSVCFAVIKEGEINI